MGKGGNTVVSNNASSAEVKKISLEELSHHRTPNDGEGNICDSFIGCKVISQFVSLIL